jgi:hypothetical protein
MRTIRRKKAPEGDNSDESRRSPISTGTPARSQLGGVPSLPLKEFTTLKSAAFINFK